MFLIAAQRYHIAANLNGVVDVSMLPQMLVQRVDVVTGGASASWGSDAVAGVVNFITRTAVDHPELSARYAFADGSDETLVQGLGGWTLLSCTVTPAFEFSGFTLAPPDWSPPGA